MKELSRREMIGGLAVGGAILLAPGGTARADEDNMGQPLHKPKKFKNEDFYDKAGKFNAEAAKEAYYKMMGWFGYPIPERLRGPDFWTLDFGLGIFLEVGMAGIFWMNNKEHNYLGHEIYLLPNQMIPEHWHEKTEDAQAKVEGWQVRHGSAYLYGEGTPTPGVETRISPSHRDIAVARTEVILKPGEIKMLGKPLEKHSMRAGADGAIVTEYASFHDMKGLRFTHPKVKL